MGSQEVTCKDQDPTEVLGSSLRDRVLGSSFEFAAEIPCMPREEGSVGLALNANATHMSVPLVFATMESDDLEGSVVWDVSIMLARLLMDDSKYPHKFFYPNRKFIE